jgi:chromosome segregation protein
MIMYLKSLTALGFKSFADKTTLNFVPGVAAIVGPNGCGKSNISDAIRWVLGEQSAKALRGGEMADVIFNGTDFRKPLGMAEVSLTIGDVDQEQLRAAGIQIDYNEVTITRRVFRDGGSEYFINKTSCRLKDIQQLFMGTGMGRSSYSIMAQGNITQIISSKPEDRRMVFEEAAGITKFKAQKKESLRKLEHTEQNLLRVADTIREVKRQIGSLQRQAGKARRYKELMIQLQHLDTQLARHQYDVLQAEIAAKTEAAEKLRVEADVCNESVLRGENEVQQLRERLAELEQQIGETQQRSQELKSQIDRNEHRIHFNEERLKELDSQNARALADITQGEERQNAAQEELRNVTERLAGATAALEQHRQALNAKKDALLAVERELISKQDAVRKTQSDLFATAQQLARVRNEINTLDLQKQGNVVRLEKLNAEKIQLEEERARLEQRIQEFEANVEAEKLNILNSRGTVEERQKRLRELQDELTRAGQTLDAALRQQAEKKSRLHVLEQLQGDYEGFGAGAVAVLKGATDVVGSLTDKIRVPDQYVAAVETALGANLQLVLTQSPETARQILADLAAGRKGKANIAALGLLNEFPGTEIPATTPANCVSALSVIQADELIQPLLQRLLGRTFIAPDLATAEAAWREWHGDCDLVTTTGEVLSRTGVYSGGAGNGNGKAQSSVLLRKNQIEELQQAIAGIQEQVNEASRVKGALQSEQTALQASLQEAQTELRTQEVAVATRQGEFNALQNSRRALHAKIENVSYEAKRLEAQEEEGLNKRNGLAAQINDFEGREQLLQAQVGEFNTALEGLRQQRDQATNSLNETKVAMATDEQLCSSFRQQERALQHRLQEVTHLLQQRRSEVESFVTRRAQFENEIAESQQHIESLTHDREQVNTELAQLQAGKESQDSAVIEREEELRGQRRRQSELQQQRSALEIELAQKNMGVENIRTRVREKYQINIEDVRSECITITIADEGPAKVQTLTPEEMAAQGAATDWDAVAEQVVAMQRRIDDMGPVNLVAIEEYEETEQRYNFLTAQHDDLVKAKEQLLDVINKINGQTKEMFAETFSKIRDNFRAMFTEVFGGGKADLVLTDEGDVLESGIEIVARPPGKQLQSITLLSGGEQTMTAVALLFSIYQVKPSPFCVLDELDAPLDESNINRFTRILQRFLSHSQFIIITHNKRTIGMADVLYGVTMEEHGVSKIVSVKFHKADEPAELQETARPLVPPAAGPSIESVEDAPHKKEDTIEVAMAK